MLVKILEKLFYPFISELDKIADFFLYKTLSLILEFIKDNSKSKKLKIRYLLLEFAFFNGSPVKININT